MLGSCSESVPLEALHHSSHTSKPWSLHHEFDQCDESQNSAAGEMNDKRASILDISTVTLWKDMVCYLYKKIFWRTPSKSSPDNLYRVGLRKPSWIQCLEKSWRVVGKSFKFWRRLYKHPTITCHYSTVATHIKRLGSSNEGLSQWYKQL